MDIIISPNNSSHALNYMYLYVCHCSLFVIHACLALIHCEVLWLLYLQVPITLQLPVQNLTKVLAAVVGDHRVRKQRRRPLQTIRQLQRKYLNSVSRSHYRNKTAPWQTTQLNSCHLFLKDELNLIIFNFVLGLP